MVRHARQLIAPISGQQGRQLSVSVPWQLAIFLASYPAISSLIQVLDSQLLTELTP